MGIVQDGDFIPFLTPVVAFDFYYHDVFMLTTIVPSGGPILGGTMVFIECERSAFTGAATHTCRFDKTMAPATILTGSSLRCEAPSHVEGSVTVTLGVNGSNFGAAGLAFVFSSTPLISEVSPLTGPEAGGSIVHLTGVGFSSTLSLACYFDNVPMPGRFISTTSIKCTAPVHSPRQVSLRVTDEQADSGMCAKRGLGHQRADPTVVLTGSSVQAYTFTYTQDAFISALVPNAGPSRALTNISVFGQKLALQSTCTWYAAESLSKATGEETQTVWISHSHVLCASPLDAFEVGPLFLTLAAPGVEITPLTFTILPAPSLNSMSPSVGPSMGGTLVTLRGAFMREDALRCKFGTEHAVARFINSSTLQCITPRSYGARHTMVSPT